MPRKIYSDRPGEIKAAVVEWLDGADMDEAIARHHENPWMAMSLMDTEARHARECWHRGDKDGARRHLAATPGGHNLFIGVAPRE